MCVERIITVILLNHLMLVARFVLYILFSVVPLPALD